MRFIAVVLVGLGLVCMAYALTSGPPIGAKVLKGCHTNDSESEARCDIYVSTPSGMALCETDILMSQAKEVSCHE